MSHKLQAFFSNGGYATWVQSVLVVASVAVALYAIKESDTNVTVSNAVNLAQKYFTEKPTLASASLRLRISQYQLVQQAKQTIDGYDPKNDADFEALFKVARPLVAKKINDDSNLQDDYNSLNDFFSAVLVCVANAVCDQTTSVKLLGWEVLGFYNAACPYMESSGRQYRYDEDSPRYLSFLVAVAGYKPSSRYFCRDGVGRYLTASR